MKIVEKIKIGIIIGGLLFLGSCEPPYVSYEHDEKKIAKTDSPLKQPLDDSENVEVYTFVVDWLKQRVKEYPPEEVEKWCEQQKKSMHDQSLKPHIACMVEGEMAGLLELLLLKNERYENITLYGKDGVGLASSGMKHDDSHFQARPNELNLGFLTPSILRGPNRYTYFHRTKTYVEYILAIYKKPQGFYVVRAPEKIKGDVLMGYVSYIAHE